MADKDDGTGVSAEAVAWALRLFIGREPVDEKEIAWHRQHPSVDTLRTAFAQTWEFEQFYNGAKGLKASYGVPPFMLRPVSDPRIPWRFEPPNLEAPASQLCTSAQFDDPVFKEIVEALGAAPAKHRKLWEHVWIVDVLATEGLIAPGRAGLGFGCGRERIPSLLAARGVRVLATDAPEGGGAGDEAWRTTQQFSARALDVFYPELIPIADFEKLVAFRPVDMNAIPAELHGQFDFCWSSCSLEHLGSIAHGLDFIENSLLTLRPGGVAAHTTEFNLSSNDATIETPGLSLFRRRDFEALALRLVEKGHEVLPLNFHPGHDADDALVDVPPYGVPHMKLQVGPYVSTSVGIAVRRKK